MLFCYFLICINLMPLLSKVTWLNNHRRHLLVAATRYCYCHHHHHHHHNISHNVFCTLFLVPTFTWNKIIFFFLHFWISHSTGNRECISCFMSIDSDSISIQTRNSYIIPCRKKEFILCGTKQKLLCKNPK